jgi:hypothetical protein
MEQRLVRAMSKKKSKHRRRRRQQQRSSTGVDGKRPASGVDDTDFLRSPSPPRQPKWRPGRLLRRLMWRRRKTERRRRREERFYGDSAVEEEGEELSRGSTPRYILDKAGIFRWPPIKLEDEAGQLLRKVKIIESVSTEFFI